MTRAIVEEIVRWIGPVFSAAGYPIIGAAVLLERSIFVGLVVPGEIMLALGGVYASRGDLQLAWVIVLGVLAAVTGETVGYWIGRRYGVPVLRRIPFARRMEDKVSEAKAYFESHGGKTVAVGRFATAAGTFVPFVAGMSRMPFWRFAAFDVPSIAVWATAVSLVGFIFGRNLELVDTILSRFGWIMLAILAVIVGAYVLWRRRR